MLKNKPMERVKKFFMSKSGFISRYLRFNKTDEGSEPGRATQPAMENTQQNKEFILLLKSAMTENMLDRIPKKDLIEICKRTLLIDARSRERDVELSGIIKILLAEIRKRGEI